MAKKKTDKRKMERLEKNLAFLMGHLKEKGERSGGYAGTVLFLNGDSISVEAALLAEMMEDKEYEKAGQGNIELEVFAAEYNHTVLRLIDKFNHFRETHGQYGKHYALELDVEELCCLRRLLDDSGITYWNY